MKKILTVLVALNTIISWSQTTKQVFFIGNSYIASNDLPNLISELASADGNTLVYDKHIPGATSFMNHAQNPVVYTKLHQKNWDFVVLQGQSQEPSFPDSQVATNTYPYAAQLVDSIYANYSCSVPLFYATWGRQNGDSQWVGINTFEKMNTRLFNAYTYMATQAQGMMVPAGVGFAHIKQDDSQAVTFNDLYTGDASHPTMKGSYLIACMFNNVIFDKTSFGNTFIPTGITEEQAEYLQTVADYTVYGIDSVKVDFRALFEGDFSYEIEGSTVVFSPTITNGEVVSWNFGNESNSTENSPTYTFETSGEHEVILTYSDGCRIETITHQISIASLGNAELTENKIQVYPNPSSGKIHILTPNQEMYEIYNLQGELIVKSNEDTLHFPQGMYIIRVNNLNKIMIVN